MIVSSLGWGLGYFGQPHILVKFMAIGDPKELKKSTRIAMTWVLLSLSFAIAIGVVGKAYLSTPLENANAERVFILMAESLSALSLQALSGLPSGGYYEYQLLPASGHLFRCIQGSFPGFPEEGCF